MPGLRELVRQFSNLRRLMVAAGCLLLVLDLPACGAPTPPPPALRLAATDLTAPLLTSLTAAYTELDPAFAFTPTVTARPALTTGLAASNFDLGFIAAPTTQAFATPLGYVTLSVVVAPANPLTRLSAAQVREIFAGRITDWGQVGGAGGAIQVVAREDNSDAARAWDTALLNRTPVTLNALVAPSWAAVREAVGQNANAIGYLPAPEMTAAVKTIPLEAELRVLLVAVALQEPAGPARDFLAWGQSAAGQTVIARQYQPLP